MTSQPCFYEVLGVDKQASVADIRKAYKKLALQHHPDRNNGCEDATAKFKEVTAAYTVLSDEEKRGRYDRFGHAGVEGVADMGGDFFSQFQDLFSDFFGGFGGFGGSRARRGPARGRDMRVQKKLSLEDAVLGCKKDVEIHAPVECTVCSGSGAKPGTKPKTCSTCHGQGQVTTGRGFIMFTQACPACQGQGSVIDVACEHCDGAGWEEKHRTVTVSFPAGIDEGHRLRVSGQGLPGPHGGPPGHLYVDVLIAPHERFERDGLDLICRKTISFPEAALGTTLRIEMLDGDEHVVKLKAGTQPGDVVSARRKGAPDVNGRGRGDLHVVVQVAVPQRLSRRAKKLFKELADEIGPLAEATAKTA